MTTEITKPEKPKGLREIINSESMQEQFAKALPACLPVERFCRVATTALTRTPKLLECSPPSFMSALLSLSAMGLEPDGRRAHLIPFENRKLGIVECQLIIDYKGLVELIRRSGDVERIQVETVCEKDEFTWENGEITHRINWRESRGDVQAVYAVAVMKSGEKQSATMTRDEVESIRARSRAGQSGPWVTDWSEMAKKTVVRRLSKMLPLSSEVIQSIERDDDRIEIRNVTPKPRRDVPAFIAQAEPATEPENLFGKEVEE